MALTKKQEARRKELQELQSNHKRWFSKEEFEELTCLNVDAGTSGFGNSFKLLFKQGWFTPKEKTIGFYGKDINIVYLTLEARTQKIFIKYENGHSASETFFLSYDQAKRDGIINLDNLKKYLK